MEQMAEIKYSGAIISAIGKIETDINNRVQKANKVYCQIRQ